MTTVPASILRMIHYLRASLGGEEARRRLAAAPKPPPHMLRLYRHAARKFVEALWARLRAETSASGADEEILCNPATLEGAGCYDANIENFAGVLKLPLGIVGPLRINGLHARGDLFVPLATTEAALVASYARGAHVATLAGGVGVALLNEGMVRSPAFVFNGLIESGLFVNWIVGNLEALQAAAEATTRFGKLLSIEPHIDNDVVFLLCRYTTGDACGQNMVTIATDAMCRYILANCQVTPRVWYIEGNFSGDKKASFLSFLAGRGRKVTASVTLPAGLVERHLHVSVAQLLDYARVADLGARLCGQIGAQGHYANGLAAFYLATGQDAACVAESAVGSTRMDEWSGDLRMSVTLPNILVGSVGGGTGLPTQKACLNILGLAGDGKAAALAEVAAALCLCGEISIMAAIAAGDFARAHQRLARGRQ